MRSYSQREVFEPNDLVYWRVAARLVVEMPDYDRSGQELRCHEVARAIHRVLEVPEIAVQDGLYELGCEHSWLTLPSGHILDAYAVGRLPQVQLVAVVSVLPRRYAKHDIGLVVREDTINYILEQVKWRP